MAIDADFGHPKKDGAPCVEGIVAEVLSDSGLQILRIAGHEGYFAVGVPGLVSPLQTVRAYPHDGESSFPHLGSNARFTPLNRLELMNSGGNFVPIYVHHLGIGVSD